MNKSTSRPAAMLRQIPSFAVALAVLAGGCQQPPPQVLVLNFSAPGANAVEVDNQIAKPLIQSLLSVPHCISLQAHSYESHAAIYVTVEPAADPDDITRRIQTFMGSVNADFTFDQISALDPGTPIPTPIQTQVPVLKFNLKHQAIEALNLTDEKVAKAIEQLHSSGILEADAGAELQNAALTIDDQSYQLLDLVDVEIASEPKCVARNSMGKL